MTTLNNTLKVLVGLLLLSGTSIGFANAATNTVNSSTPLVAQAEDDEEDDMDEEDSMDEEDDMDEEDSMDEEDDMDEEDSMDEEDAAYDNYCEDDELAVGDEITLEGEDLEVEEDDNGLFVTTDEGSLSITEFADDCETVTLESVDGIDFTAEDVDE